MVLTPNALEYIVEYQILVLIQTLGAGGTLMEASTPQTAILELLTLNLVQSTSHLVTAAFLQRRTVKLTAACFNGMAPISIVAAMLWIIRHPRFLTV